MAHYGRCKATASGGDSFASQLRLKERFALFGAQAFDCSELFFDDLIHLLLMVIIVRQAAVNLAERQKWKTSLDFIAVPVVGYSVKRDFQYFGLSPDQPCFAVRAHFNMGVSCWIQHGECISSRNGRASFRENYTRGPPNQELESSNGPVLLWVGQPASIYACNRICAATRSRRALRCLCVSPASHNADSASLVVKRSSYKTHGKPVASCSQTPNARAAFACSPSLPSRCTGKPITMLPTSSSLI